jgi:hypothetical protein
MLAAGRLESLMILRLSNNSKLAIATLGQYGAALRSAKDPE